MTNRHLARIHSALRRRLRLRQEDLARAAGVGRWKVHRLEAGQIDAMRVGDLRKLFEQLGARLDINVSFRGAELDRILDDVHARLAAAVVQVLKRLGWATMVEVSFSMRGDRGSIDILAWHAGERALLVIEIKSEIPGVDPLLRPLDVKVRVARDVARDRYGWPAATVSRLVVLPEDRTARRVVRRHESIIRVALPARSRDVRRWLRAPRGELAGLWFLSLAQSTSTMRNPSTVRRVQRPRSRLRERPPTDDFADLRLIDPHNVGGLSE